MTYEEYLKTPLWKTIRQHVLSRDNHTCKECGRHRELRVHHLSYPKVLGTEPLDTMITLCATCHDLLHRRLPTVEKKHRKRVKHKKYMPRCKVYTKSEIADYVQNTC